MKCLGLIGGMSWQSTTIYYRHLNRLAQERLGGLHSAQLLLWSFDFDDIAALQSAGDWEGLTARMIDAARRLERGGAEALLIATNTMHLMAEEVQASVDIPLLHIVDALGTSVSRAKVRRPVLLATRYTMEQDFYKSRLTQRFGVEPLIPDEPGRTEIHRVIYDELCHGLVTSESKAAYLEEIRRLRLRGADGVILGCTEIGLLLGPGDVDLPIFDTTLIHAEWAMDWALS